MTDRQRAAVYAAESAAFEGTDLEVVVPIETALAAARAVVETEWWPGPEVHVRSARSDARSSNARDRSDGVAVSIAVPQATFATVAHELAHALAGPTHGHDAVFRRALLDVIVVLTNLGSRAPRGSGLERRGTVHVDQLADALRSGGLSPAERSWPAATAGGPIQL